MSGRYNAARQNLTLLQEIVKKDPESYVPEFQEQYRHYQQNLNIFHLQPTQADHHHIQELVNFIAQVSNHYPKTSADFGPNIMEILKTQAPNLDPELRMCFCKALVLLRNKKQISGLEFVRLIFDYLLRVRDKSLRKFLFTTVVSHLKLINTKAGQKNPKLNGEMQTFIFSKLKDSHSIVVRTSLLVMIECFRKNIWKDKKTANAIADCCFHPTLKIRVTALKLMLGGSKGGEGEDSEGESDSEPEERHEHSKTMKELMVGFRAGKKSRKRQKVVDRAKAVMEKEAKRVGKKRTSPNSALLLSLEAINHLYDPQEFSEKLFRQLEKSTDRFELKLLYMALMSKTIGVHKLLVLGFYSFLHRYFTPHQRDVTKILLYGAQACHELVPPDIVEGLLRVLVDNFVTERNSPEVMTVGLNAAREILSKAPLAINEDLLGDLTLYKKYRNKNVSMAARSLISLFRQINPSLLHRKDRGQLTEFSKQLPSHKLYGQSDVATGIAGSECLTSLPPENEGEEVEVDEDSGSEGSWINVSHSDGEMEVESGEDDSSDSDPDEAEGKEEEEMVEGEEKDAQDTEAVTSGRILSQEEFRKISVHQIKMKITPYSKSGKKRKLHTDYEKVILSSTSNHDNTSGFVDMEEAEKREGKVGDLARLKDIMHLHKRPKMDKKARVECIKEGREGREEFGWKRKKARNGPHVGKTNQKTQRKKNFQMLRPTKIKAKRQQSFSDRQRKLRQYLVKQKKMK